MKRLLISAVLVATLSGCEQKQEEPNAQQPMLPFKKVGKNEQTAYVLSLPDKGYIYISADTSSGSPQITGAAIASSVGTVYSADYSTREYMILNPVSESEDIYIISERKFRMAPESVQIKHKEMHQMFDEFFGKHVGSGGDVKDFMKDAEELRERLKQLNETK